MFTNLPNDCAIDLIFKTDYIKYMTLLYFIQALVDNLVNVRACRDYFVTMFFINNYVIEIYSFSYLYLLPVRLF